jgi:carboxyl-terminal processing protease
LRDNPGGVLEAAVDLCAQFLPAKTLVARTRGRPDTDHSAEFRTPATDRPVRNLPLALLINGESASSSEIVAGALRDHDRATLIGDNTYGKGSVQTIVQMGLDTGAAMRLTTARFFTPKGKAIDKVGVAPDMKSDDPMETATAHLRKTLKNS